MNTKIDKKAQKHWEKSSISYDNYQDYIKNKLDRYAITFIDLLYISNFKGGYATINENESSINYKLKPYISKFIEIEKYFGKRKISDLGNEEISKLISLVIAICELTHKNKNTRIDGFSVSYLSALLHSHFPTLIPILDRRLLINLGLAKTNDINKQGQIKKIEGYYEPLIKTIVKTNRKTGKSLREIDREFFSYKIERLVKQNIKMLITL